MDMNMNMDDMKAMSDMDTIGSILKIGELTLKLQIGAKQRGMSEREYLEHLLSLDDKVPLKTFAHSYAGTSIELAKSLAVTRDTVAKWRSGYVKNCSAVTKGRIYTLYGVKV